MSDFFMCRPSTRACHHWVRTLLVFGKKEACQVCCCVYRIQSRYDACLTAMQAM